MNGALIRCALVLAAVVMVVADCGGDDVTASLPVPALALAGGSMAAAHAPVPASPPVIPKSAKRGVAYDLVAPEDFKALSQGVSWWYNWSPQPGAGTTGYAAQYQMDFYPMIWGFEYDVAAIEDYLRAHPQIKHLLVMNEPNLTSQADVTPQQAASLWPDFEAIAAATGVQLVGPAVTWGTMPGYQDPVAWLDAFYAAYQAANEGRAPRIDALAFHWYDYGLAQQLDRLAKFGKPFWVTEVANWHGGADGAQIDNSQSQQRQMAEMVAVCESRADVLRYAWFTGRRTDDAHATSLLAQAGRLTPLGQLYLNLPYNGSPGSAGSASLSPSADRSADQSPLPRTGPGGGPRAAAMASRQTAGL